jgi:disulfide bond formation protein DsbB
VLGGIASWYIGHYAYEGVAKPILEFYGKLDSFEALRNSASRDAILLMLVTSGLAHLPPIKVVTILSGAMGVDIWLFIAAAIVARGARFLALLLLRRRRRSAISSKSASARLPRRSPSPSSSSSAQPGSSEAMLRRHALAPAFVFVVGLATILAAWGFQIIGGYVPCALCLQQRWPYYIGLPIAFVAPRQCAGERPGVGDARLPSRSSRRSSSTARISASIMPRRVGVVAGPPDCGIGGASPTTATGGSGQLDNIRIVSCTRQAGASCGLRPVVRRVERGGIAGAGSDRARRSPRTGDGRGERSQQPALSWPRAASSNHCVAACAGSGLRGAWVGPRTNSLSPASDRGRRRSPYGSSSVSQ